MKFTTFAIFPAKQQSCSLELIELLLSLSCLFLSWFFGWTPLFAWCFFTFTFTRHISVPI